MGFNDKAQWSGLELVRSARLKALLNAYGVGSNLILGMSVNGHSTGSSAKLKITNLPSGRLAVHVGGATNTTVKVWDSAEAVAYKTYTETSVTGYWVEFLMDAANRDEVLVIEVIPNTTVGSLVAMEGRAPVATGGSINQPVRDGN
jgi:hypothetical protein